MTASRHTGPLADNLRFWQTQRAQLERDRHNLIYVLYAAVPVALLVRFFTGVLWMGAAAGGALLFTWGLGMYMCFVRRGEYNFALREAETELLEAEQSPEAKTNGHHEP